MIPVYFCFDFRKVKQNLKAKHCVKYCNFTRFFGVEILWKDSFGIVSGEHTRKLGEITVFYAVVFTPQSIEVNRSICQKTVK